MSGPPRSPFPQQFSAFVHAFERAVVLVLAAMMMVVLGIATLDLGWLIVKDVMTPPVLLLTVSQLLEILSFFLLLLIGIELLETFKIYVVENVIRVAVVLEIALIALARKVIALDVEKYPGTVVIGVAALIAALAVALRIQRRRATRLER